MFQYAIQKHTILFSNLKAQIRLQGEKESSVWILSSCKLFISKTSKSHTWQMQANSRIDKLQVLTDYCYQVWNVKVQGVLSLFFSIFFHSTAWKICQAAKLLLEKRKNIAQDKINKKILRAAKGANRWAKYACIIALLSFLAFVAAWIYEHSQSLIATSQQIEKVKTSPTQLLSTNETSDTSNGKHQIPQEKSEIKNKQVES